MVEPWYVECFRESIPILGFIFTMFIVARCMK
jgi:hypothetical protein